MHKRIFILGSEWLYFKIYSGPKTLENIFIKRIVPQIYQLYNCNVIDYFFFIRYQDPEYHIRLRLHFDNIDNIGNVIANLYSVFDDYVNCHVISKVLIDTYSREIERYSDEFIDDIEKVFFYDSDFVAKYLASDNCDDYEKWQVSTNFIDLFLDRCGLSLDEKVEFCNVNSLAFSKEIYNNDNNVNKLLNKKYRDVKDSIDIIIGKNRNTKSWSLYLTQYLDNIHFFTSRFKKGMSDDKTNYFKLISSIIHMHINRMFRTKQRVSECVIYYHLSKFYKSQKAIDQKQIKMGSYL